MRGLQCRLLRPSLPRDHCRQQSPRLDGTQRCASLAAGVVTGILRCGSARRAHELELIGKPGQGVFASMKAVEIRVRRLAGLGEEVIGVDLMNKAFGPTGPLTDPVSGKGEQEGTRMLFAGAYAVLRNPAGHRQVDYTDLSEAAEAVQTASLLMRVLDSAENRLVAAGRAAEEPNA
jgi:uncharacterized protein (TIGR02391 family)